MWCTSSLLLPPLFLYIIFTWSSKKNLQYLFLKIIGKVFTALINIKDFPWTALKMPVTCWFKSSLLYQVALADIVREVRSLCFLRVDSTIGSKCVLRGWRIVLTALQGCFLYYFSLFFFFRSLLRECGGALGSDATSRISRAQVDICVGFQCMFFPQGLLFCS